MQSGAKIRKRGARNAARAKKNDVTVTTTEDHTPAHGAQDADIMTTRRKSTAGGHEGGSIHQSEGIAAETTLQIGARNVPVAETAMTTATRVETTTAMIEMAVVGGTVTEMGLARRKNDTDDTRVRPTKGESDDTMTIDGNQETAHHHAVPHARTEMQMQMQRRQNVPASSQRCSQRLQNLMRIA
jgi:hypothetical protein